jgi:23S rRNA (adenine1618-N6)-methyltransferase
MNSRTPDSKTRPAKSVKPARRAKAVPARTARTPAPGTAGAPARPDTKAGLHPRNRHRERYDFPKLIAALPALAKYVKVNPYGDASIDFAKPQAVKTLNQAILLSDYGVRGWDLPAGFLCPPIPGRAEYVHHVADLLAAGNDGVIPRGPGITVLDLGVGASCIYPLLGHREYGWSFVGSESDADALAAAQRTLRANPALAKVITLRRQAAPQAILSGVVKEGERYDVTVCNPPFHASAAEALAGTQRKWRNLGKPGAAGVGNDGRPGRGTAVLNFGGQASELWCPGGEVGFISRFIAESAQRHNLCLWYTSLVSKEASLPALVGALRGAHVRERRIIEMVHGQKRSRIVAWSFLNDKGRQDWRKARWG